MKRQIIALLLLLCMLLTFVSCGEHIPPINSGGEKTSSSSSTENGGGNTDPDPDGDVFTVTVMLKGSIYIPEAVSDDSKAMKVRFTGEGNYHTVNVGADGKASISGLDGDYTVTLLNLPEGYTYNPNIYNVNNDKKDVVIELIKLSETDGGNGADTYSAKRITKTGTYRAEIKDEFRVIGAGKKEAYTVYYFFAPQNAGTYYVESLMDVTAEMFNPLIDVYIGSVYWNQFLETQDGGGISGNYTKNFKYKIQVNEDELGATFIFGIKVEGKDAVYPVNVDFSVSYGGTYEREDTVSNFVDSDFIPNYKDANGQDDYNKFLEWYDDLTATLEADLLKFGNTHYIDAAIRTEGKRIFDEDYYKYNPDDGFYHVYDEVKYADNGGFGPILYADMTSATIFIENPFNTIEYAGNKALTVNEGKENYKLFIEGYANLIISHGTPPNDSKPYLCNSDCPCYLDYKEDKPGNNGGSCTLEDNCTRCNETCRHLPESMKYQRGYADIVNADGRVPVTEELKEFLQKFSVSQRLFSDGNGYAETHTPRYDAYEDSQWLFACGYYY